MTNKGEARLLWAITEGSNPEEIVVPAAHDLGMTAQMCTAAELLHILRPARFDVVGIEIGADPEAGIALIRQVHARFPRVTTIAALCDAGVSTLRAAFEAGASDVVALPLSPHELRKALFKFRHARTPEATTGTTSGNIITVYGVRGGLGTTTVAVNLAAQLNTLAHGSVALADLDLQRGDVTTFLNLNPLESIASIASATTEVDEIFLHGMLTRHPSGLSILSAPSEIEEADSVGHDETKVVLGLLHSQFRYTVVDTPRLITGATVAAFEHADRVLLLTDLSIPSVRATRRVLDLLERLSLNMSHVDLLVTEVVRGPVDLKDAVRSLDREPLAIIPRDEAAASQAMNSGIFLNGSRPSGLAAAMAQLAAKVAGVETDPKARRGTFFRRLFTKEIST